MRAFFRNRRKIHGRARPGSGKAPLSAGRDHRRERRRGRRRGGAVRRQHAAFRARESGRRAGRSRHQQARAGREDDRGMARQAGVDRAPHAGDAEDGRRPTTNASPIPQSKRSQQPDYAKNEYPLAQARVSRASSASARISAARRWTVSQPQPEPFAADWHGGFYCPCHGSLFDLAGRVYKNKPAPDNLPVPPYKFVGDTQARDRRRHAREPEPNGRDRKQTAGHRRRARSTAC